VTDRQVLVLAAASIAAPAVTGVLLQFARSDRAAHVMNAVCALLSAAVGTGAAAVMIADGSHGGRWLAADTAAGVYIGVATLIALMSALLSPAYLRGTVGTFFAPGRSVRLYYLALYAFWAALIAIPLVANLGVAWILVEATTAASAVLVAFTGKPRALEAGWKYLILTTLGMSLAFLGIVIMFVASRAHGSGIRLLDWSALPATLGQMPHGAAVAAYALVVLGFATKIGWAPVHNWLPDAHSEAPAPVSAMLSSALLPIVMLLAWRLRDAAEGSIGHSAATVPLATFGLVSVGLAVPFLWRPMAWKRLLAYHSLEHMGIITVGIAFAGPLALAGVILHVAGHAFSKALGFYAAMPLYEVQPDAAHHSAHGVARSSPTTFAAMAVTAVTLGGLPPSPLFFSELFIILGGVRTGHVVLAGVLAVFVALAFIGLLHALLEALQGPVSEETAPAPAPRPARRAPIVAPTLATVVLLAGLTASAWLLPDSGIVHRLAQGIG
jgi:hydrogenase-4 component F